jgi:hypothetical protein
MEQIGSLLDYIVQEMLLHAHSGSDRLTSSPTGDQDLDHHDLTDLSHQRLNKRIQLVTHFFKSKSLDKQLLFEFILVHLKSQKEAVNRLTTGSKENVDFLRKIFPSEHDPVKINNLLTKVQTLVLYSIYLEENSIIYHIANPSRLFSSIYHKIDLPTQVLLSRTTCFLCLLSILLSFSFILA